MKSSSVSMAFTTSSFTLKNSTQVSHPCNRLSKIPLTEKDGEMLPDIDRFSLVRTATEKPAPVIAVNDGKEPEYST